MRNYLVTWYYTRPQSEPECLKLHEALSPITVWEILDPICCTVLVNWESSANDLGRHLINYLDPRDKLLVMEVSSNCSWYGLEPQETAAKYLHVTSLPPPQARTDSPERTA